MTSRTRFWVLAVSTPLIAFALIGGYLGQARGRDDTYSHLRVFDDVVTHVVNNYVEEVDLAKAMQGAMRGLSDALDPDSAYLPPDLAASYTETPDASLVQVGLDLTRQYYLRVVAVRDGSPAARAGLRAGDYVRAIDGRATRDLSVYEGLRMLRGKPGTSVELLVIRGNAADPHEVTLVRERPAGDTLTSRMADATTGYLRIVEFTRDTPDRLRQSISELTTRGAATFVVDVRGSARGDLDDGIAAARLFVSSGALAQRQTKTGRETIGAGGTTDVITAPLVLLVDQGTGAAAEVFAAALDGNERAELVGERTLGRAARQQLVRLPDGSGLLLSSVRYLTPSGSALHERGLTPDVAVPSPDVEFGAAPPDRDGALERALERLADKKAA